MDLRRFNMRLLLLLVVAATAVACSEVKEVGEYDNWKERNIAFADSLSDLTAGRVVFTAAEADAMQIGTLYAIETSASTSKQNQYVYVKKLTANQVGVHPYYTDKVKAFYYGTYINGERFDGNFKGYSSLDKGTLDGNANMPDQFNASTEFGIANGLIAAWVMALQYMRQGERWMVYAPYQSAYGKDGSNSIMGYSLLTFDLILDEVVREEE